MNYERILSTMPNEFTRKELMRKVINEGYSYGYADQVIEYNTVTGNLERIKPGRYRQTMDSTALAVNDLHEKGFSYRQIADKLSISKTKVGEYLNG